MSVRLLRTVRFTAAAKDLPSHLSLFVCFILMASMFKITKLEVQKVGKPVYLFVCLFVHSQSVNRVMR